MARWDWLSVEPPQVLGIINQRMKGLSDFLKKVPSYPIQSGEVGVKDTAYPFGHVARYGAVAGMTLNQSPFIQNAVDSVIALGIGIVYFGAGNYYCTETIQVDGSYVTLQGLGRERTTLQCDFAGAFFQLDEDDGAAYNTASYNGAGRGFAVKDLHLMTLNRATALANGEGNYRAGSYAIRDWRSGSVALERVAITGFEYGFWGIQSDINCFADLIVSYNKTGLWYGPRSDQALISHVWSFGNDAAFSLNGVEQIEVVHWISDTDGSASTYAANVKYWPADGATPGRACSAIVFDHPWLEATGSLGSDNPGFDVPAFFAIGLNDGTQNGGVVIRDPFVYVYDYSDATKRHVLFMADVDHAAMLDVRNLTGIGRAWNNLRAVFRVTNGSATTTCRIRFTDADNLIGTAGTNARLIENYNANGAFVQTQVQGFGGRYGINVVGGTQTARVGYLGLLRSLQHNTSVPSAGQSADVVLNSDWTTGKDFGWAWDDSASAARPLLLPTIGADRGDNSVTLTVNGSDVEQLFNTALTAGRTVTLSTTGALNGHRFRVVRGAGATGAFNLDVGGLKTLTAASQWCDVMYNGSAWVLRAYGTL